jgi:hypothetical protein
MLASMPTIDTLNWLHDLVSMVESVGEVLVVLLAELFNIVENKQETSTNQQRTSSKSTR